MDRRAVKTLVMHMTSKDKKQSIFIIAGEQSGDVYGAQLIQALKKKDPSLHFFGVGGNKMEEQGLSSILPFNHFQVMGFVSVLLATPRFYKMLIFLTKQIIQRNPIAVIFIDFPGFNLRLARSLKKQCYPGKMIHYICPHVWAWRKYRIHNMVETLDLLLTLYSFERECFSQTALPVKCIGNPLYQKIVGYKGKEIVNKNLIGLFPGSRQGEIIYNLPKQLEMVNLLLEDNPKLCFGLSVANESLYSLIQKYAREILSEKGKKALYYVHPENSEDLKYSSCAAIATSGTITLELALYNVPTLMVYSCPALNYYIAKYILRLSLPYYCIVNVISKKEVFPELIYTEFTATLAAEKITYLYRDTQQRKAALQGCKELASTLKTSIPPEEKAAEYIMELLS